MLLALLAIIWLSYITRCGLALTNDSYDYLAAAQSLADEGIMRNREGKIYSDWPPLYSFCIYLFRLYSPERLAWLSLINFILSTFFLWQLLRAYYQNRALLRLGIFALILLGLPWQLVQQFAWSESGFLLLQILHFWFFYQYSQKRQSFYFWSLVIVAALLCLQRHVGIFWVATSALSLLAFPATHWKKRLSLAILYSGLAALPWLFWVAYAVYHRGWLFNPVLEGAFAAFGHNLVLYADSLSLWFLPAFIPLILRSLMMVSLLAAVIYSVYRQQDFFAFYLLLSILFYLFLMINMEASNFWEVERFVVPAYAPYLILIGKSLTNITLKPKYIIGLNLILFALMLYPLARGIKFGHFRQEINCKAYKTISIDDSLTSPKYKR